jgi:RimJ/RimL family protein N-acetyltransferase
MDFSPLAFREFQASDERGVIRLLEACYGHYQQVVELDTLDDDLLKIEEVYGGPGTTFRVLLDRERVVGTIAVKRKSDEEAELKRVFLDPSLWGKGYGKKLILWSRDWAQEGGYQRLRFWSDQLFARAHAIYLYLGCVETGETRYLGGRNKVSESEFTWELE